MVKKHKGGSGKGSTAEKPHLRGRLAGKKAKKARRALEEGLEDTSGAARGSYTSTSALTADLLPEELAALQPELSKEDGDKDKHVKSSEPVKPHLALSKKQRKALMKLKMARDRKTERTELITQLSAASLPSATEQLLRSTSSIGRRGKETMKQKMARSLREAAAGLPLSYPDAARRVFVERPSAEVASAQEMELVEEEEEEEEEEQEDQAAVTDQAVKSDSAGGVSGDNVEGMDVGAVIGTEEANANGNGNGNGNGKKRKSREPCVVATVAPLTVADVLSGGILTASGGDANTAAFHVPVQRPEAVAEVRLKLPVVGEEQRIMEAIHAHPVVVVCGETGSGKTTQIPQFAYEGGFGAPNGPNPGMIGVTQPRRVATVSMAQRVASELGVKFGSTVGYQIRYEAKTSPEMRIKFLTDGLLLREIQSDFLLSKYSLIVLDEAHERNVNTDLLLGLLSRVVPLRAKMSLEGATLPNGEVARPLRLVVMSATLRVEEFTENKRLFPSPPPVIEVAARQHPITLHYARKTELDDYSSAAFRKVAAIHQRLPKGAVLVFMPGQAEIDGLVRRLRAKFPATEVQEDDKSKKDGGKKGEEEKEKEEEEVPDGGHMSDDEDANAPDEDWEDVEEKVRAADDREQARAGVRARRQRQHRRRRRSAAGKSSSGDDYDDANAAEDAKWMNSDSDASSSDDNGDDGSSSEDSDSGDEEETEEEAAARRAKEDVPDHNAGPVKVLPLYSALSTEAQMEVFEAVPPGVRLIVVATNVAETSLTIPGVRYVVDTGRVKKRVYDDRTGVSEFVVEWTAQSSASQRAGRAGRVGPGHVYRLYSSAVFENHFQQWEAPELTRVPVEGVILQMKMMGIGDVVKFPFPSPPSPEAVTAAHKLLVSLGALDAKSGGLTELGRTLAAFPTSPRNARMLALGDQGQVLPQVIAMVAVLSVSRDIVVRKERGSQQGDPIWYHRDSDVIGALRVAGAYEWTPVAARRSWCGQHGLHERTLKEVTMLREQLSRVVEKVTDRRVSRKLIPPTTSEEVLLRRIITAGFVDHVGRRSPGAVEGGGFDPRQYQVSVLADVERAKVHPSSSLSRERHDWIVYRELMVGGSAKLQHWMRFVTAIDPKWLPGLCPSESSIRRVVDDPAPRYRSVEDDVVCFAETTFGKHGWDVPIVSVPYPEDQETAKTAPLGAAGKTKVFARALLEGDVFEEFRGWRESLVSRPALITKAHLQPKVALLMAPLVKAEIGSRQALQRKWAAEPKFLLRPVLEWYGKAGHGDIRGAWPPKVAASSAESGKGDRVGGKRGRGDEDGSGGGASSEKRRR